MGNLKLRAFVKNENKIYPVTHLMWDDKGICAVGVNRACETKEPSFKWHLPTEKAEILPMGAVELLLYTWINDTTHWEDLSESEREAWLKSGKNKKDWLGREIYIADMLKVTLGYIKGDPVESPEGHILYYRVSNLIQLHFNYLNWLTRSVKIEILGNEYEDKGLWREIMAKQIK